MDETFLKYLDRAIYFLDAFTKVSEKRKDGPPLTTDLLKSRDAVIHAKSIVTELEKGGA